MTKVFLALGSNEGQPIDQINQAIVLLKTKLGNIKTAPVYLSKAVGFTDQANFYNTAIMAETDMEPLELLNFIKSIEQKVGRVARFKNGPREIDIDIIFYGDLIINLPELEIPHPRFSQRDFVLQPIIDIDPSMIDPQLKQTVSELLGELPDMNRSLIEK